MTKKQAKLTEQIRQAASEYPLPQIALARAAKMDATALCRFISGERGLSMENLDALADALHLCVVVGKAHRKTGGK